MLRLPVASQSWPHDKVFRENCSCFYFVLHFLSQHTRYIYDILVLFLPGFHFGFAQKMDGCM